MKLGARILKTGIAIVLALYLSKLLHMPVPVLAGISAIFAIQPTIYRSYRTIVEQLQGNLIGACVAVVFVLFFGNHIFIIGLAVIVVISINLKLKMGNTITLSIVTTLSIMEAQQGNFYTFAFIRLSSVLLGILSSFLVNLVFIPPKYETKLYVRISNVTEDILKWIRMSTRHVSERTLLKKDIGDLKNDLFQIEQLYHMFKEERGYLLKENHVKARKKVVYRQMLITTRKAFETLKRIHKFEHEISMMPEGFQVKLLYQLDCLIRKHEQLLLKYIGKVKFSDVYSDCVSDECLSREDLLALFYGSDSEIDDQELAARLVPLLSAIMEYDEQMEHLEKLISSFQTFHKDDNEVYLPPEDDD
ncbi:aromatic acid exporter family protein [Actinomycetes bacterium NPDC127524]